MGGGGEGSMLCKYIFLNYTYFFLPITCWHQEKAISEYSKADCTLFNDGNVGPTVRWDDFITKVISHRCGNLHKIYKKIEYINPLTTRRSKNATLF